ncbi:hypothetical protein [Brevibacillus fulvus]|uniref:Uncharacterized protein n=1 Tax=Brevibacillus fulvus TaxID=1125967 RepID=A0A939BWY6_9BACL|nr:hypothetical protein [Brevibacillus fulvus]MBM7592291.1 hypothetical protein [Brevibacillus fulvus]
MKKKWAILLSVVCLVVLGGIVYYSFYYKEHFYGSVGGVFLAEEYEEKYKDVVRDINVHKTRYDKLLITHEIDLDGGSLTFELYDPNNRLIKSGKVTNGQIYAEKLELPPIKGEWRVEYHTNAQTNGQYNLTLESSD